MLQSINNGRNKTYNRESLEKVMMRISNKKESDFQASQFKRRHFQRWYTFFLLSDTGICIYIMQLIHKITSSSHKSYLHNLYNNLYNSADW